MGLPKFRHIDRSVPLADDDHIDSGSDPGSYSHQFLDELDNDDHIVLTHDATRDNGLDGLADDDHIEMNE